MLQPMMSVNEIKLFERYLKNCKVYFEFGCGGSTCLANKFNIKIYSIDTDKSWLDSVKKYATGEFKHIDIGEIKEFGYPKDDSKKEEWYKYYESINLIDEIPDLILVDGRFRVCCVLSSIKKIDDGFILIHDFWNRKEYHDVLEFLECVDKIDTLGVFKIKQIIDYDRLEELKEKYKFDKR